MSTEAVPPFNAQPTLGALFIGVLISCFLFGIVTLQTYLYYRKFPEDRARLKIMVAFVWVFELAHCICVCHAAYYMVIIGYGNPSFLLRSPNTLSLAIIFSGIIGPIVQVFFAERVRIVSEGNLIIPIFCWTLSSLRLTLSLIAAGKGLEMTNLAQFQAKWEWLLTAVLSIGVAVDLVIAASLCYYLTKRKAQSMERTAQVIDRIMVYTIQNGLLTTAVSGAMMICFLVMPHNFIWLAIFTFLARLFSNSLLASLNSRTSLRNPSANGTNVALPAHDTTLNTFSHSDRQANPVMIKMTTLTEIMSEDSKPSGGR